MSRTSLGSTPTVDGRWRFEVWAPHASQVEVELVGGAGAWLRLEKGDRGYHVGEATGLSAGDRYWLRLDGGARRADPASRWQPDGLQGPSALVDPAAFHWSDANWAGVALHRQVIYEMHIGTFSAEGTFEGAGRHLDHLLDVGVTAVELMPVAQFPGQRNWGYDGVLPYAVQDSYGGPGGLAAFVDQCHRAGMAVIVDVVYNHVGPEGNYLGEFGPYFTSSHRTPWGDAVNFADRDSDEVRRWFLESAQWLVRDLHVDGLRVDAVHAIVDPTATPFVEELCTSVHALGVELDRTITVVAETAANDPRTVQPVDRGGWGFDGHWNDDFHHALHVAVTSEQDGYYGDYRGVADLIGCIERGYAIDGRYSSFLGRRHGRDGSSIAHHQLVVFDQNHDQVGNRMVGERLTSLTSPEACKLAVAMVLLLPFTPLIFMGEEYGETAPFPYFVDHSDPGLIEAVRLGRAEEFAAFAAKGTPPDPASPATFEAAKLDHTRRGREPHATRLRLVRELLRLRAGTPAFAVGGTVEVSAAGNGQGLAIMRRAGTSSAYLVANFSAGVQPVVLPTGDWELVLDTAAPAWGGPGGCERSGRDLTVASWSAVLLVAG